MPDGRARCEETRDLDETSRHRVWIDFASTCYQRASRDGTLSRTISADCERSYFNLENEKELQKEKRKELERLLRSVFGGKNRSGDGLIIKGFTPSRK